MNILHVITDMDPKMGGVCQAVRTMVYGLNGLGHTNEVVTLNDPDEEFLSRDKFRIHPLGKAKGPWAQQPALIPWLSANLTRFDSVIVHGLWQYHGYAVRSAFHKLKSSKSPKLFIMPHGMLDPYFQKAKGRRLKAIRNVIYWRFIESKLINTADGLLFTCEEERSLAREPFRPYQPVRELVVGLGVEEPPPFKPEMRAAFIQLCPATESRPYILFLSRIHEKKGTDILVKAYLDALRTSGKDKSEFPILVIAGPGLDTPFGKMVQSIASQSGLNDSIVFPGMLINDSKWGAFHGCEAFVLPSHQENFGIAVVEALACRKPVLISNQINIWREIHEGGAGIVNDSTVEGTTASLEKWIAMTTSQKSEMSASARNVYESSFSVDHATRSVTTVLQA